MKNNLKVEVKKFPDIANAVCSNRGRCVLANAVKRTLGVNENIYINVDGNGCAFSVEKLRYVYRMPRTAIAYLRKFDELGKLYGQDYARVQTPERAFTFTLIDTHPTTPSASRTRKDQINKARQKREAERKALGQKPKTYARWAGM